MLRVKRLAFATTLVLASMAMSQRADALVINRAFGLNWTVETTTNSIGSNPYYYNPTPQPLPPVFPAPPGYAQNWSYYLPLQYVLILGTADTNYVLTAHVDMYVGFVAPDIGLTIPQSLFAPGEKLFLTDWNAAVNGRLIAVITEASGPNAGRVSYVDVD